MTSFVNRNSIVVLVLALTVGLSGSAAAAAPKTKKLKPALTVQGFRPGMSMPQVKWLLRKNRIRDYETGFSDLFVYDPLPETEVTLRFFSSARGQILGKIELSASFRREDAPIAVPRLRKQLLARYGQYAAAGPEANGIDFCWGQCGEGAAGTRLKARIAEADPEKFVLVLENRSIEDAARAIRKKKIRAWLGRWITQVSRFRTGMTLRQASFRYQKRYRERLPALEERDETVPQYRVVNYGAEDKDFFAGLDYESLAFEGRKPGEIVLKFTGDQAGDPRLNKRLYYASFSTTDFSEEHEYGDLHRKLAGFVKIQGPPDIVQQLRDGIIANWQRNSRQVTVTIMDSGFMRYEQSDPSLEDAYRNAAVVREEGFESHRFDKPMF